MSDQPARPTQPTPAQMMQAQQQAAVAAAMRGAVPRLYTNGIHIAQTASDISLILMSNLAAVGVVNMSYISAKSLRNELDKAISQFEKAINQDVLTIEEIDKKLQKLMEEDGYATRIR